MLGCNCDFGASERKSDFPAKYQGIHLEIVASKCAINFPNEGQIRVLRHATNKIVTISSISAGKYTSMKSAPVGGGCCVRRADNSGRDYSGCKKLVH